jgi:hypothetical protein
MLAEEATGLAFGGTNTEAIQDGLDALTLLETEAAGNITDRVRQTRLEQAIAACRVMRTPFEHSRKCADRRCRPIISA